MADKTVSIQLTARDNASPAFQKISASANAAAGSISKAGTTASGALVKLEQSLARAEATSGRFSRTGAAVGASLGAVTGVLSTAARAYAESEVSQQRLSASIEATGRMYEEFAGQIERAGDAAVAMAFDDEAAADSISTLTQVTNDASLAIERQGLVMDIARGRGIDLAAATKIVAAAETERFGALARIGIVLGENATKEEAIAALQAKYAGQAEAYAETNRAAVERLGIEFENLLESVGASTGGMAEFIMLLPGLSAGATAAAAALGGLMPLLKGAMGSGGMIGGAGVAAGGVLGGLGLVGYMLANPEGTGISEQIPYFEAFQAKATELELTLGNLSQSGNAYAAATGQQSGQIVTNLTALAQRHQELLYKIENDTGASTEQTAAYWHELGVVQEQLGQRFGDNAAYYLSGLADDLDTVLGYTGEGAGLMQDKLASLNDEFERGWLSPSEYASQVDILASSVAFYDAQAANGVKSTVELAEAFGTTTGYAQAHAAGMERQAQLAADVAKAQDALAVQFEATTTAYAGTTDAMASGFRTVVSNTEAIAQQSQAVADWAEGLIAAEGVYSKLDDLVAAGRISGASGQFDGASEYAAAQRSFNSILEDNEAIQESILVLQAKQAPTIAALVSEQEKYITGLANQSGEVQMLALAYSDAQTASQALSLTQGLMENADVFGPMVESAAALNPYLALILEDMGVISRGSQGEITLTGAEDAQSKLDTLTSAIEALTQAQWVASFDGNVSAAEAAYERATGLLVDWDGSEGSADLNVNDNATGTLYNVISLLDAMDGRSVTNYINTISTFSGSSISPLGYASGGTVPTVSPYGFSRAAANGMTATLVGERGPEVLMLPGGAQVMNTEGSRERWKGSGGITVHVHVAGNVGVDDLTEQVSRKLVPAIQRAVAIHERST